METTIEIDTNKEINHKPAFITAIIMTIIALCSIAYIEYLYNRSTPTEIKIIFLIISIFLFLFGFIGYRSELNKLS